MILKSAAIVSLLLTGSFAMAKPSAPVVCSKTQVTALSKLEDGGRTLIEYFYVPQTESLVRFHNTGHLIVDDLKNQKQIKNIDYGSLITFLEISDDQKTLSVGLENGKALIYDFKTMQLKHEFNIGGAVQKIYFFAPENIVKLQNHWIAGYATRQVFFNLTNGQRVETPDSAAEEFFKLKDNQELALYGQGPFANKSSSTGQEPTFDLNIPAKRFAVLDPDGEGSHYGKLSFYQYDLKQHKSSDTKISLNGTEKIISGGYYKTEKNKKAVLENGQEIPLLRIHNSDNGGISITEDGKYILAGFKKYIQSFRLSCEN